MLGEVEILTGTYDENIPNDNHFYPTLAKSQLMIKAFDLLLCLHRQTEQPLSSVAKPNLHWSSRGHAVLVRPVQLSSEMWMHQSTNKHV